MVLVFQFIDEIGRLRMGFVIEERGSTLYGNLAPEKLGHLVLVGILMIAGSREMKVTTCTDNFLCH
jgi:hypothetical protein